MKGETMRGDRTAADAELTTSVWQQTLPVTLERVALLEAFARSADGAATTIQARLEAARVARQLAAFLGSFGRARASHAAWAAEQLLRTTAAFEPRHVRLLQDLLRSLRASLSEPADRA